MLLAGRQTAFIMAAKATASWAKPTISIANSVMPNIGTIAGACYEDGTISDCWANAVSCATDSVRTGGITARLRGGEITNCYVLGADALGINNALVFSQLNEGTVTASADLSHMDAAPKSTFWKTCGWDFTKVWDNSNGNPILRSCDSAAQRKGQS